MKTVAFLISFLVLSASAFASDFISNTSTLELNSEDSVDNTSTLELEICHPNICPPPSRPEHPSRICVAADEADRQYLGYGDDAGNEALGKCFKRSQSRETCRVKTCIDDYGLRQDFAE